MDVPKVTLEQQKRQTSRLRRLGAWFLFIKHGAWRGDGRREPVLLLQELNVMLIANTDFYAGPNGDVPETVKFCPVWSLSRKLLVWLAISPRGSAVSVTHHLHLFIEIKTYKI